MRLAIDTGRELTRRLRSSGQQERAKEVRRRAALVAMVLDGRQNVQEVLDEWKELLPSTAAT